MSTPTASDAGRASSEQGAPIESVALVGAGAMGAMYAEHFAKGGFTTSFVATGERAERLRDRPVSVNGTPLPVGVLDPTSGEAGPVDLLLFAVKDAGLPEALESASSLVGEHTTVLSVMNGLASEKTIAARVGAEKVVASVALAMDAQRGAAGGDPRDVIYRQAGRLDLGNLTGIAEAGPDRQRALQAALDRAGLAWEWVDGPDAMAHTMWWKFMVNTGVNQASAAMRLPYGAFVDDGAPRSLMWALIDEVVQVANAEGIALDQSDLDRWDNVLAAQPAQGWTSMHQDVEAGRPTETDMFAGHVIELGRTHGIATPYNQAITWVLKGIAQGAASRANNAGGPANA